MNERKATKRALLTSITALVMCVVMLVGTTFAWFTDTATANVNKIQAGNLDVALEMLDTAQNKWVTAEGKTLNWVKAQGGADQAILWEPGAEYKLPDLKVVNNGNLALKYEIKITGAVDADGNDNLDSMKLLNVLKFKSVVDNVPMENAYGQTIATGTLDANGKEQIIELSAKMDENAGNDYMNMALSNITVTVKAMQASYEYDSNGKTYDENADMTPDNLDKRISANVTIPVVATRDTVLKNADGTVELTAPAGSIDNNATSLTLKVEPRTAVENNFTVNAGQTAQPYDISLVDEDGIKVTAKNSKVFTVKLYVGKGLNSNDVTVYHNDAEITATYDNNGYVTFTTDSFSPFTVVFDTPVAIVRDTYYNTLAEAVAAAKDGDTITLLKDSNGDGIVVEVNTFTNQGLTVDFNGHTYSVGGELVGSAGTGTNAFQLNKGNKITFKNGTIAGVTEGTKPAEDMLNWHGAPAIVIQNYCDLTLDNMVVTGGDETQYTMSNKNGNVTIKDTTINEGKVKNPFIGDPFAFDVYGGFESYGDVTVTVDGNSVINGDIELARDTGSSNTNKNTNTLELKNCTINGNIKKSSGLVKLMGNITLNGNIDVSAAVNVREDQIRVADTTVLNLNGKINTPAGMGDYTNKAYPSNSNFAAIYVEYPLTINAEGENGIYASTNNGSFAFAVMGRIWPELTINGGTYHGYGTVAETNRQTITINGGNFSVTPFNSGGSNYLLNKVDESDAKIIVKGGTFVNYDPSSSASESPAGNFVADGYKVVTSTHGTDTWYTVVHE